MFIILIVLLLRRTLALLREKILNEPFSCNKTDENTPVINDRDKVLSERCVQKLLHSRVYTNRVYNGLSLNGSLSASYIDGNPFFFKCHKRSPSVKAPTYLSSSSRTGTAVYEQFSIFSIVCRKEKLSFTQVTSLLGVKKLKMFINTPFN